MFLELNQNYVDERSVQVICSYLREGKLVVLPTDTVYNITCDLYNKKALENLAKFKNIKLSKAKFSIICANLSEISNYVKPIDKPTFKLLKHNLPGPFTFILNATNEVQKIFDSNKKEIGIRIPNNNIIKAVVENLGNPIATTSIHDEEDEMMEYLTDATEIFERYENKIDLIVDGGFGKLSASTVVDCTTSEYQILRQGIGILNA